MSSESSINQLLNDKLYQVIGSTPASIAESLKKVDLKGKSTEGGQLVAISIFAAAVNKATLETFMADTRFAAARPLIIAALSISGKSNMTALTLLGHCFLATDMASNIVFAREFRKKMGQSHLWSGELDAGSLSEVQKKILKEKKRVTDEKEAAALGNGFIKYVGLANGELIGLERAYFGTGVDSSIVADQASRGSNETAGSQYISSHHDRKGSSLPSPPRVASRLPSSVAQSGPSSSRATLTLNDIPADTYEYRSRALNQPDSDILESLERRGLSDFVSATRSMMTRDPDGSKTRSASTANG